MFTSPPWPSMTPSPTTPDFAPFTLMNAEALPHTPGSRVANSVTPASTHSVPPLGIVSGPDTRALLLPLAASFTALPASQPFRAVWIAAVSRAVSAGTPFAATACVAVTGAHAAGIVGSGGSVLSPAPQAELPPPPPCPAAEQLD